jgi:hypothetical protein
MLLQRRFGKMFLDTLDQYRNETRIFNMQESTIKKQEALAELHNKQSQD